MVAMWGLLLGITLSAGVPAHAADPVALRAENFTVPPSTQPLVFVQVKNLRDVPYEGSVAMKPPEGWRIAPPQREVALRPGETQRVPFTIEQGRNVEANAYPIEVSAIGAGATVVRQQTVVCASAPYYKPTIDGDPSDWKDSIPVTFTSGGKRTTISTFWNRRQFSLLVAVEEDKLVRYDPTSAAEGFDAVQVAVSPQDTRTGTSPDDEARRFEFLFVAVGEGTAGQCFQLAEPDMKLAEAAKARSLVPLLYNQAEVAVRRDAGTTYYECSLSFTPMRDDLRPSEGREFFMSVLVHDRDGTGIRDWGRSAGLWPSQRNPLAWSRWEGSSWGEEPPYDNKLEWGLCTSKY
ncbi:MAG TPA: NEW3 domain-containing protein [Thermoguttaceae bacterium]|nr:NEW3 domain-containing protein [Thermoguttaceae bacterium]